MAETTNPTLKATAYTAGGTERERLDLPGELFDGTVNMPVMHQAVKAYLGNQRLGLAYTKTRGLVTARVLSDIRDLVTTRVQRQLSSMTPRSARASRNIRAAPSVAVASSVRSVSSGTPAP